MDVYGWRREDTQVCNWFDDSYTAICLFFLGSLRGESTDGMLGRAILPMFPMSYKENIVQ
jgi:hypothetical protein